MHHTVPGAALATAMATALATSPPAALAQGACAGDLPPPDPCVAGTWIGQNTAMQQVAQMLERMAPRDASRTVLADVPALLGLTIYPNGFYHTLPIHQTVSWEDVTDRDMLTGVLDLNMPTETGHILTDGDSLGFCVTGPGLASLRAEGTSTLGGSGAAFVMPGPGGEAPAISFHCDAASFSFRVDLPAPVGPVTYDLRRIPTDRFDDTFRDLIEMARPPE